MEPSTHSETNNEFKAREESVKMLDCKKVALVSYCCDTGIGIAGHAFYSHLPFLRWLVVPHSQLGVNSLLMDSKCLVLPAELEPETLETYLSEIEVLFCIERAYYPTFFKVAKDMGIRIVLMPNAEWFSPENGDMAFVDTFIAPTRSCHEMLVEEGFGDRTCYIPHPIDTDRFQFRLREKVNVYLHCHGWGGYKNRKGTDIVLSASSGEVDIPLLISSQKSLKSAAHIKVFGPTATPELQYVLGDVAVQPSRWEGVGLQILEAMACGLPVIVPDAPPMNEYYDHKDFHVPAHSSSILVGQKNWTQWEMDATILRNKLRELHNMPIAHHSVRVRELMEARSWRLLRDQYSSAIGFH